MDKDIAVLIIHALIKQLGMHGAGPRHGERRVKAGWWRCRGEAVRERQLTEKN